MNEIYIDVIGMVIETKTKHVVVDDNDDDDDGLLMERNYFRNFVYIKNENSTIQQSYLPLLLCLIVCVYSK